MSLIIMLISVELIIMRHEKYNTAYKLQNYKMYLNKTYVYD